MREGMRRAICAV